MSDRPVLDLSPPMTAIAAIGEEVTDGRDYIAELERENERLRVEVDEAVERAEHVEAALEREQQARLLADNRVAELEEAIANHRRQITMMVPAKSGTAADQALWWWVQ